MKKTSRSLALRIAQLLEEHSAIEISEAISILGRCGTTSELLTYLAAATGQKEPRAKKKTSDSGGGAKPIDQMTSKAVRDLEKSDPERHQVLSELDKLVRRGEVLETNESLRRFGETVSKDFHARTARRDNISALMSVLAPLPVSELELLIKRVLDNAPKRKSDEYQNLARFLIQGKQN